MIDYEMLYLEDTNFKEYVDKGLRKEALKKEGGKSLEEYLKLNLTRRVGDYYRKIAQDKEVTVYPFVGEKYSCEDDKSC